MSFPPGGLLRLAFALTSLPPGRDDVTVRFRAELDCDGATPRELSREVLSIRRDENPGWVTREVTLPADARSCRLVLTADGESGAERVAVWGVPRVVRPLPPDTPNLILISLDTLRADHLSGTGTPGRPARRSIVSSSRRGRRSTPSRVRFP